LVLEQAQFGSGIFVDTNATFDSKMVGPQNVVFGSFSASKAVLWSYLVYLITRNGTLDCSGSGSPPCDYSHTGISSVSTTTPFRNYSIAASIFGQWPVIDAPSPGISSLTEQYLSEGFGVSVLDITKKLVDLSTVVGFTGLRNEVTSNKDIFLIND
jgi:hypothetical protein